MSKRRRSSESLPTSEPTIFSSSRKTFERKFCFAGETFPNPAADSTVHSFQLLSRPGTRSPAESAEGESVEVVVSEEIDVDYSCYTWPSSAVMAQYIWFHQENFIGRTVLEVSSGTSVPGILAAKLGASVILSEYAMNPSAIQRCKFQAENNEVSVRTIGVIWGQVTHELAQLQDLDFILLSDVFYEPSHFEDVVFTIRFLLERHPNAVCLSAYQIRDEKWSLHFLLNKWNMTAKKLDLESFDADRADIAGSHLPGSVEIDLYRFFLGQ
ncbi:hypothetical protein RvY_00314 [Ramazzottius varieornatus]|uniref:Methyltransferase-like protein 23 n=1 Tax=Ramazzottius varieornatus TaxID=947166 RepID=A0A1D1UCD1_RAMVA|nr:hypothetical protein RvY_00314 [Ramazzottius varieornatus]